MKKLEIAIVIFLAAALGMLAVRLWPEKREAHPKKETVVDFDSCVAAGNLVLEIHPRRCQMVDGRTFVELIKEEPGLEPEYVTEKGEKDLIRLEMPEVGSAIVSPVKIRGKARGNWFFEGSFSVVLVDWDGRIIAQGPAEAKGNWMAGEFVPFEVELEFEKPSVKNNGALILKKDNPSGLPENDDALEVPVIFR